MTRRYAPTESIQTFWFRQSASQSASQSAVVWTLDGCCAAHVVVVSSTATAAERITKGKFMRLNRGVRVWFAVASIAVGTMSGAAMRAYGYGTPQQCSLGITTCPSTQICQAGGHCAITAPHKCITTNTFGACTPAPGTCTAPVSGCQFRTYGAVGMNMCAVAGVVVNPFCYGECL